MRNTKRAKLLRSIAHQLSLAVRATDPVARLGGDGFGVILTDLPSVKLAEKNRPGSAYRRAD